MVLGFTWRPPHGSSKIDLHAWLWSIPTFSWSSPPARDSISVIARRESICLELSAGFLSMSCCDAKKCTAPHVLPLCRHSCFIPPSNLILVLIAILLGHWVPNYLTQMKCMSVCHLSSMSDEFKQSIDLMYAHTHAIIMQEPYIMADLARQEIARKIRCSHYGVFREQVMYQVANDFCCFGILFY